MAASRDRTGGLRGVERKLRMAYRYVVQSRRLTRRLGALSATFPVRDERSLRYYGPRFADLGPDRAWIGDALARVDDEDTFWDVGARWGAYTAYLSQVCATTVTLPRATRGGHLRRVVRVNDVDGLVGPDSASGLVDAASGHPDATAERSNATPEHPDATAERTAATPESAAGARRDDPSDTATAPSAPATGGPVPTPTVARVADETALEAVLDRPTVRLVYVTPTTDRAAVPGARTRPEPSLTATANELGAAGYSVTRLPGGALRGECRR